MKSKRRGMIIDCQTFRVVPDPVLDLWRDGKLHDSSVKVWLLMQRAAYDFKGEINFTTLQRYCKVGSATLSRALKQLIELGLVQKSAQVYSVVFNKPSSTEVAASTDEATTSIMKASASIMKAATSTVKVGTSTMKAATSTVKVDASTVKADLSSNSPGELRIHIDTEGDSRETPPVRCAASPVSLSPSTNGAQAASSIHISPEDLALLAQRYGIRFAKPPSPWAAVIIRAVLNGEGGEGHIEILRTLAARGSGDFGGAVAAAPREANTTVGG